MSVTNFLHPMKILICKFYWNFHIYYILAFKSMQGYLSNSSFDHYNIGLFYNIFLKGFNKQECKAFN